MLVLKLVKKQFAMKWSSQEKVHSVYWLLRESWKVLTWNTAFNQVPKILACAKGSGETLKIADADIIVGLL